MKDSRLVLFVVVVLAAFSIACVPEPDDGPTDAPDDGSIEAGDETNTQPAALEAARPLDGDFVRGEFVLAAIVDAATEVEVRFLLDGREVGVVNEAPYELTMNACDLTAGNHAYTVEIVDEAGQRDFVEQWFTVEGC